MIETEVANVTSRGDLVALLPTCELCQQPRLPVRLASKEIEAVSNRGRFSVRAGLGFLSRLWR